MTKAKFGSLLLLAQGILVILFVVFVDDGQEVRYTKSKDGGNNDGRSFMDIHISTFMGFGLIMTFLRRYSRGMLVHVFLVGTLVIQWATLLQGFFTMKNTKIGMGLKRMINADYAVVSVLVSLGAVMGKCNSLQILIIGLIETFFFTVNETINLDLLKVSDLGRSMIVHVFGAYFGLAVSRMVYSRKVCMSQALSMSGKSEMYSFIGTLFLWTYWPSVNASLVDGITQDRAIINTFYALAASCSASFSFTVLQSKAGKFNIFHLQNSTLAGGVAIGSIAAMSLTPWGAVIVGVVGALGSVLGYKYAVPKLRRVLKIHDTRGVQATHGIPGIISGLASILVAVLADETKYGATSLYTLYPARAPLVNSTELIKLREFSSISPGKDRKGSIQGLYQLACLGITIVIAIVGGLITGLIIRCKFFDPVSVDVAFDDHDDFEENNCIDVSSDIDYDDDDGDVKHDVIRAGKRRVDVINVSTADNRMTPLHSEHSLVLNHKNDHNHVTPQLHVARDVELDVIGASDDHAPLLENDEGLELTNEEEDVSSSSPPTDSPLILITHTDDTENA